MDSLPPPKPRPAAEGELRLQGQHGEVPSLEAGCSSWAVGVAAPGRRKPTQVCEHSMHSQRAGTRQRRALVSGGDRAPGGGEAGRTRHPSRPWERGPAAHGQRGTPKSDVPGVCPQVPARLCVKQFNSHHCLANRPKAGTRGAWGGCLSPVTHPGPPTTEGHPGGRASAGGEEEHRLASPPPPTRLRPARAGCHTAALTCRGRVPGLLLSPAVLKSSPPWSW